MRPCRICIATAAAIGYARCAHRVTPLTETCLYICDSVQRTLITFHSNDTSTNRLDGMAEDLSIGITAFVADNRNRLRVAVEGIATIRVTHFAITSNGIGMDRLCQDREQHVGCGDTDLVGRVPQQCAGGGDVAIDEKTGDFPFGSEPRSLGPFEDLRRRRATERRKDRPERVLLEEYQNSSRLTP